VIKNQVHLGDCLDIMKFIPDKSVDMVLCDLPYGVTRNKWDSVIPLPELWIQYNRIVKENGVLCLTGMGLFTAQLQLSNPKNFKYKICWIKNETGNFLNANKMPLRKHEDICIFYKAKPTYNPIFSEGKPYKALQKADRLGSNYSFLNNDIMREYEGKRFPSDVITFGRPTAKEKTHGKHPTQKPLALGQYLVKTYTNLGDVVLDNTCGVGSFLVAAKMEGRQYIGIEMNAEYHSIALKRLDEL